MNKSRRPHDLKECKIQASIVLKSLHASDSETVKRSIKRFQKLAEFSQCSTEDVLKKEIKYKHALALIAIENGFKSWVDLKTQINFIIGGFLNHWFPNYPEAKTYQKSAGGYLLPYKKQYFICEAAYIKQLGFDPDDPDWKLIDHDWAQPPDQAAWRRLYKKWMQIQEGRHA